MFGRILKENNYMKVSEMIKNLQEFMEENGDIDCYYAEDDEGNGYKAVHYSPTLMYVDGDGGAYSIESIDEDRKDGYLTDEEFAEFKKVCIVN